MKVPSEFDPIRPYETEELQQAYDRLLHEPVLQQVLQPLPAQMSLLKNGGYDVSSWLSLS